MYAKDPKIIIGQNDTSLIIICFLLSQGPPSEGVLFELIKKDTKQRTADTITTTIPISFCLRNTTTFSEVIFLSFFICFPPIVAKNLVFSNDCKRRRQILHGRYYISLDKNYFVVLFIGIL